MPMPWMEKKIEEGDKVRRTIVGDFGYYHGPDQIWERIHGRVWEYSDHKKDHTFYEVRDRALMALMYISTCRVSELVRAYLGGAGYKGSVRKNQFHFDVADTVFLRDVIILKRREPVEDEDGNKVLDKWGRPKYQAIQTLSHYPKRDEIPLPREGMLGRFTELVVEHLDQLNPREELFKIRRSRAYQIINHCTRLTEEEDEKGNKKDPGMMCHYFREMGLKIWCKIVDRNIADLKKFSGHARVENLLSYLEEGQLRKKALEYRE